MSYRLVEFLILAVCQLEAIAAYQIGAYRGKHRIRRAYDRGYRRGWDAAMDETADDYRIGYGEGYREARCDYPGQHVTGQAETVTEFLTAPLEPGAYIYEEMTREALDRSNGTPVYESMTLEPDTERKPPSEWFARHVLACRAELAAIGSSCVRCGSRLLENNGPHCPRCGWQSAEHLGRSRQLAGSYSQ